jgi:ABC-type phosphate transport system substrate-binding protein
VAGATVLALSAAIPAGATVTDPGNNLIVGSGSSTTYTMMQQLDLLFNNAASCTLTSANTGVAPQPLDYACVTGGGGDPVALDASPTNTPENPWADVAVQEPAIGSGSGINQLSKVTADHTTSVNVANNVNFARSSRAAASTDYTGLNFVAYAEDAVSWFHYLTVPVAHHVITKTNGSQTSDVVDGTDTVDTPSKNVTNLTKAQVQGIWNGTYKNWNQVGGDNAPIVVASAQTGSGTQATWKSFLGYDPTSSSNNVNCVGATCGGPMVIFENQLASLNAGSFLGDNQIAFKNDLAANHQISGTQHNTVNDNRSTTVALSGTAKKVYLTSAAAISVGSVITIGGVSGTSTVAAVNPATSKKPASVTLAAKTSGIVVPGAIVTWTNTTASTQAWSSADVNATVRADAIYFYSYGKWKNQTGAPNGGSARDCAVNGCGGIKLPAGYTAALGAINSITLNDNHALDGTFPAPRYLFNVYSNGSNAKIKTAATPATLNYVSEAGFICKPQNSSINDPATGNSYVSEIQATITASGFFPLSAAYTSGGVNTTPIADEGGVAHPVGGMTLTSNGHDYSKYMNVTGTGLAGGYQSSNGDPSGFCLVSTTDGNASS